MDGGEGWGDPSYNPYPSKLVFVVFITTSLSYNTRFSGRLSADSMDPPFSSLNTDFSRSMRQSHVRSFSYLYRSVLCTGNPPPPFLLSIQRMIFFFHPPMKRQQVSFVPSCSPEPLYPYSYAEEGEFSPSGRQGRSFSEIELSSLPNSYEPAYSQPFPPRILNRFIWL